MYESAPIKIGRQFESSWHDTDMKHKILLPDVKIYLYNIYMV